MKKQYNQSKLTPAKLKFSQVYAATDNASEAVRVAFPHLSNPNTIKDKGHRLLTNTYVKANIEQQKERMQQIAEKALNRIENVIDDGNERNALQASVFAYEQVHGKAKQRVIQESTFVTFALDLSGGEAPPIPQEILDELR